MMSSNSLGTQHKQCPPVSKASMYRDGSPRLDYEPISRTGKTVTGALPPSLCQGKLALWSQLYVCFLARQSEQMYCLPCLG